MQIQRQNIIAMLRKASEVLQHEAMATDINTVAEALHQATDEQFSKMVKPEELEKLNKAASEEVKGAALPSDQLPDGKGVSQGTEQSAPEASGAKTTSLPDTSVSLDSDMVKKSEGPVVKSAAEAAGMWSKKAADLVLKKLALDASRPDAVKAAELPKEQTPNGEGIAQGTDKSTPDNSGAVLPKEQTPDESASLKSDMVAKSNGPVDTMASKAASEEEKKELEEKETKEASTEEELEVKKAADNSYEFAGIKMASTKSFEPARLGSEDADLRNLFN